MTDLLTRIEANRSELESLASSVGIDFSKSRYLVEKGKQKAYALEKADKGRVAIFVNPKVARSGQNYHQIVFFNHRHGGESAKWSSFESQASTDQPKSTWDPSGTMPFSYKMNTTLEDFLSQISDIDPDRTSLKETLRKIIDTLGDQISDEKIIEEASKVSGCRIEKIRDYIEKYREMIASIKRNKNNFNNKTLRDKYNLTGEGEDKPTENKLTLLKENDLNKNKDAHDFYLNKYNNTPYQMNIYSKYFDEKGILEALQHKDIKLLRDRFGSFIAIPLSKEGHVIGFQRIYDNNQKRLTPSIVSGQYNGSHYIIGDDGNTDDEMIYITEGFATGYPIFIATGCKVVVALNANNIKPVAKKMKAKFSCAKIIIAADNDCGKNGNTGLAKALETAYEVGTGIVFPPAINGEATDWNDIYTRYGLKKLTDDLTNKDNRLIVPQNKFAFFLEQIKYASKGQLQKLIKQAANFSGAPFLMTKKNLMDVIDESKTVKFNRQIIEKIVNKAISYQIFKAKEVSEIRPSKVDHYFEIETVLNDKGHETIPGHLVDDIFNIKDRDAIIIVRSPMGTSKTEVLMKRLLEKADRGVYIAPRRSLISDAAKRLNLMHYDGMVEIEAQHCKKLACCINSVGKEIFTPTLENLDVLCLDEAIQSLPQLVSLGRSDQKKANYEALEKVIDSAKLTVICDATANEYLVERLRKLAPEKKICVFDVKPPTPKSWDIRFTPDMNKVRLSAIESIKKRKKVLIATDSKKEALKMEGLILKSSPKTKVLVICREPSKNRSLEINHFYNDPNSVCQNYDVIIYSPAITSGLSITTPYFDQHVGLFHGAVNPMDIMQMLGRDRTAKSWQLCINNKIARINKKYHDLESGLLKFADKVSGLDGLVLSSEVYESQSRDNLVIKSLHMLENFGHKINLIEGVHEKTSASLKKLLKEVNKQIQEKRYSLIKEQRLILENEYDYLSQDSMRTAEDAAKLDKYRITNYLCSDVTDESISFYDDDGLNKIKLHDALESVVFDKGNVVKFFDTDEKKKKEASLRFHAEAKGEILAKSLEILGVSVENFSGEFNHVDCQNVIDYFGSEERIEEFNYLGLGYINKERPPRCATSWVRNLLKKLGLKVGKRKSRGRMIRFIDEDSVKEVRGYLGARKSARVNAFHVSLF